jgi:DNA-binding transcriptional MerR regulator
MDDGIRYSIGELARRTGLPVRTIRFYSDLGVVPPTDRSPAGYRQYDLNALTRLDLVRTLRDLDVDLATIRRVLDREIGVAELAAAHADALDTQIRTLRLRRAVLRAVAKRGSTPEELTLMHRLARLSEEERRRIINDFIDETFDGLNANPEFLAMMRAAMPELPDDPRPEQVDSWVELAELVQDADFRASVRRMAEYQAAEIESGVEARVHHELANTVVTKVGEALAAGIDPVSPEAEPVVDELIAAYAAEFGVADTPEYRRKVLERLEVSTDPRAERYWHLLAIINGREARPTVMPVYEWFIKALRA